MTDLTPYQEKLRVKMLRNNARAQRRIEELLADQEAWNEANPHETPIDVNGDHCLTLMLQWLDQQKRELEAKQCPLSDMPPRLAKILETL